MDIFIIIDQLEILWFQISVLILLDVIILFLFDLGMKTDLD